MSTVTESTPEMNIPGPITPGCRQYGQAVAFTPPLSRAELASCRGCVRGLVPAEDWYGYSPEVRALARDEGRTVAVAPGWCYRCYRRRPRTTSRAPSERSARRTLWDRSTELTAAEQLEDLAWMAATGESLAGAAMRLQVTEAAVESFLIRHGSQVLRQLRAQGVDLGRRTQRAAA